MKIIAALIKFYLACYAVMCQNWAGSGPMLAASGQNRPSSGMFTVKICNIYM